MQISISYIDISARGPICTVQTNPDRLNLKTSQGTFAVQHQKLKAPQARQWHAVDLEFLFCVECVEMGEHQGSSCSDICACVFYVCLCLCVCFVFFVFFVVNVKRWERRGSSRSDVYIICALGFYVCLC